MKSMHMDSTHLQWAMGASPLETFLQAGTDTRDVHWKLSTELWGYSHHDFTTRSSSPQTELKDIQDVVDIVGNTQSHTTKFSPTKHNTTHPNTINTHLSIKTSHMQHTNTHLRLHNHSRQLHRQDACLLARV